MEVLEQYDLMRKHAIAGKLYHKGCYVRWFHIDELSVTRYL